jgi:hypothetical protein
MASLDSKISTKQGQRTDEVRRIMDQPSRPAWHDMLCSLPQLRRAKALERKQLTLLKSPLKTLYYFGHFSATGLLRGSKWFVSHPLTVFVLFPLIVSYMGAKQYDYAAHTTQELEVRRLGAGAFCLAPTRCSTRRPG